MVVVRRGGEPLKGEWSLPGGVLETGETIQQGIVREVKEETGLDVEPLTLVGVYDRIILDAAGIVKYHYVLIDYECRVIGGQLLAGSDVTDVRWARWDEIDRLDMADLTKSVIRKVLNKS